MATKPSPRPLQAAVLVGLTEGSALLAGCVAKFRFPTKS